MADPLRLKISSSGLWGSRLMLCLFVVPIVVLGCTMTGCAVTGGATRFVSPLDVRYREARLKRKAPEVTTSIYRRVLARSMYSRCRMAPSDSVVFNATSRQCSTLVSVILGASRLVLESAADPRFLRPVKTGRRLRWVDFPRAGRCVPR